MSIYKPFHNFKFIGDNKKEMIWKHRTEMNPALEYIYKCDDCQSEYRSPTKFPVRELNITLSRRFPCVQKSN